MEWATKKMKRSCVSEVRFLSCERPQLTMKMRKSKTGMEREESVAAGTPGFPRSKWSSINTYLQYY